jgi:WD40 repeat protein
LNSVTFSRDGKLVASADWGLPGEKIKPIAKIWEVATGKQQHILAGHSDVIWSVAFSTDGTILASGSSDNTVKLWSVTTGKELTIIKGHSSTVRTLAFSPDGTMLATGSWDHTVKLWDVKAFMKAK